MVIYRPDGQRFLTILELDQERQEAVRRAEEEHRRAEEAKRQADKERRRANETERQAEEERRRADEERREKEQATARAERLAALLRALGVDPDKPPE